MKSTTQALLILILLAFISSPCLAYNVTSDPTSFEITGLNINESRNISFTITNYGNDSFNITLGSKNNYVKNFTSYLFNLSTGSVSINATTVPFMNNGNYNDTILILNNKNLTVEEVFEIPVKMIVGKVITAEFFLKKCFIDNNTEYCSKINITDIQNVTLINQTNVTETYNMLIPIGMFQEWVEQQSQAQQQIKDSIINASQSLTRERSQSEIVFQNAQTIKGILKNNLDTWMEIKPVNTLNITGLDEESLAYAIQYLETNNEIAVRVLKEDMNAIVITPQHPEGIKSILHTQIALEERVNNDNTYFYAELVIGVVIVFAVISLISVKLYGMYKGGVRFKK